MRHDSAEVGETKRQELECVANLKGDGREPGYKPTRRWAGTTSTHGNDTEYDNYNHQDDNKYDHHYNQQDDHEYYHYTHKDDNKYDNYNHGDNHNHHHYGDDVAPEYRNSMLFRKPGRVSPLRAAELSSKSSLCRLAKW